MEEVLKPFPISIDLLDELWSYPQDIRYPKSKDLTHHRKIICDPKYGFAVGVLVQFFENLIRESSPKCYFVKEFFDAYFSYLYLKNSITKMPRAKMFAAFKEYNNLKKEQINAILNFLMNKGADGNLSKIGLKIDIVAADFQNCSEISLAFISLLRELLKEEPIPTELIINNLARILETRIDFTYIVFLLNIWEIIRIKIQKLKQTMYQRYKIIR